MELLKLLSANEVVAQVICFFIILAILRKFLWKRFLCILDKRKEMVSEEFKNIENMKIYLRTSERAYSEKIAVIEEEVRRKIQDAIAEGRKAAGEIIDKAQIDGERILANAKDSISIEIAKAREELKDELVELAIGAAGKIVQEKLSEDDDKKIVEDFLKNVNKVQ